LENGGVQRGYGLFGLGGQREKKNTREKKNWAVKMLADRSSGAGGGERGALTTRESTSTQARKGGTPKGSLQRTKER